MIYFVEWFAQRRAEPHSSQEYGQLRKERLAMEKLRQTIQGIYSLSEMMGITREQFMECVHDVVLESDLASLHV